MKPFFVLIAIVVAFSHLQAQMEPPAESTASELVQSSDSLVSLREVLSDVQYPELARNAGIEGEVVLRIETDEDGHYAGFAEVASPSALLAEAVAEAFMELENNPTVIDGIAAASHVNIRIGFKLDE
ncbi:MAG: TonB family protein [Bacteroidota bacterium]